MATVDVLASLGAKTWCVATIVGVVLSIATTYSLCVFVEHQCVAWLPMISDTFVPAPGNYLSRWVLNKAALSIAGLVTVAYFDHERKSCRKFWLYLAVFCCACLAVVGAVCESTNKPSCEGNSTLHSASAVVFFIGMDFYCASLALIDGAPWAGRALVAISFAAKLRWEPGAASLAAGSSFPWLPVVEYVDTAAIMGFICVHFLKYGAPYSVAYVTSAASRALVWPAAAGADAAGGAAAPPSATLLAAVNVNTLLLGTLASSAGTVALTFAISLLDGTIDPKKDWPMISDLWWAKPDDMISRFLVVGGVSIAQLTMIGHYFLSAPHRQGGCAKRANLALHALAFVGLLGLDGVGVCDEKEGPLFHSTSAAIFFGSFGVYMLVDGLWGNKLWNGGRRVAGLLAAVTMLAAKGTQYYTWSLARPARWWVLPGATSWAEDPIEDPHLFGLGSSISILEWTAWASFLVYLYVSVTAYPAMTDVRLALVKDSAPATTTAKKGAAPLLAA